MQKRINRLIEGQADKKERKKTLQELRLKLLRSQLALSEAAEIPVVIMVTGQVGSGRGETVNLLNKWLENRGMETHAFGPPNDEERARPPMWRYWRSLPPAGRIGIYVNGWYGEAVIDRVQGLIGPAVLETRVEEVREFEKTLAAEGALILKFWYRISRERQAERLHQLESDPVNRWRVNELSWLRHEQFDAIDETAHQVVEATDSAWAPWHVLEGGHPERQTLQTAAIILDRMQDRLRGRREEVESARAPVKCRPARDPQTLEALDLTQTLDKTTYHEELTRWQDRLSQLVRDPVFRRDYAVVAVFEGHDAAGKGGSIHRVTAALDARHYRVISVAAPTDEERAQPWIWRFWRQLPSHGRMTIFDRSWYGRVLVERVEGFAERTDWRRAYGEINHFEQNLLRSNIILAKFWLAIDADEQLARFQARAETPWKAHKLTEEDWRNRERWDDYQAAINDMLRYTDTTAAPWHVIEANDKRFARVKVIKRLCAAIEGAMESGG
ncbi:polyphosphate:AMP phosphotransferase [Alkalilimnicola ehrlichii MLHE-1]|uniref:Polyphosphate:AMP phosphotransferase n=1 Tax=Alkalilimnicola ehrlichii (strain ATCC BAA-1101 / DSM 17681 / MLHE-1) TaxID=187272 RepID=Q0A9W0_ALKEH|nr:polyphosphate:AMP phosphotransferase [Alkalilimnicola ehrlichii]ABI56377.1 Polyphosphate:AMP phosphotransferase [Alkalilimnicola ehrlichii MLHE-1]